MTTFQDRFVFAFTREQNRRNDCGEPRLSKTDVWKAAGKSSGSFTHWSKGNNGASLDTCFALGKVLRVNPHWLFDESKGIDDTLLPSPNIQNGHDFVISSFDKPAEGGGLNMATISHLRPDLDVFTITQYDTGGSMGHGLVLREQPGVIRGWQVNKEWIDKNARNHTGASNLCIVTGFGDSMRPIYNPGDPLLVDRGVTKMDFDGVYFFRIADEGYIKRLQKIPGEDGVVIWATSANKEYKDFPITSKMDFEILGRVIRVWCGTDF